MSEEWDENSATTEVVSQEGAAIRPSFVDGVAFYQITDKGVMPSADVSSAKFWASDEL